MLRTSERAHVLDSIEDAIKSMACSAILDTEDDDAKDIEDLVDIREAVTSHRYRSRDDSAGWHIGNTLEEYIYEFPEKTFLALFRMHRASFWQLVDRRRGILG